MEEELAQDLLGIAKDQAVWVHGVLVVRRITEERTAMGFWKTDLFFMVNPASSRGYSAAGLAKALIKDGDILRAGTGVNTRDYPQTLVAQSEKAKTYER